MTHVHLDIWTPDETPEGRSDMYYFWHFLIGSLIFFLGYTVFATPWVALGYELTPDYNERTRLMGVQNFISNFAFIIAPWFLVIMTNPDWFRNQIDGAKFLALMVCIATIALGVLPAFFLRERVVPTPAAAAPEARSLGANVGEFLSGLVKTVKSGPFLLLCLATFLIFNSFIMISSFQIFVFIYHISAGSQVDGAWLAGIVGTVGIVAGFGAIVLVTWLGTRIGKRRAFFVSTGISMLGYALKWFCYRPEYPMLALVPAPFLAFGLSGLFTLMGSMIADVVDLDELRNMDAKGRSQRREGMFGSIYWWVVKVGQAVALGLGGYLLVATGFDIDLGANQAADTLVMMRAFDAFIPLVASSVAIYAIAKFPITEEMARRTRRELERRRVGAAVA
ncbi:MAG: MFS transporter [Gemmatimonadota bacterium]|nr:MFS transporter [Gemmatimonadota bacterium]MDE2865362.1 MFS transporter [Gemmatimonadota bacterium]